MLEAAIPSLLLGLLLMEMMGGDSVSLDDDPDDTRDTTGTGGATSALNMIMGTESADELGGTHGDDRIILGHGNDVLAGTTEGNDVIHGGGGDDTIMDEAGSNIVFGGDGDDFICVIDSETDVDTPDTVFGGEGEDTILGDHGDVLTGGAGTDTFTVAEAEFAGDPVIITDAEEEEEIRITVSSAMRTEGLDINLSDDGQDTLVSFRGEVIVILEGVQDASNLIVKIMPNIWLD